MPSRYPSILLFADLQRQLNLLFERAADLQRTSLRQSSGWLPKVDVVDRGDRIVVAVEAPGIPHESLELSLRGAILTIRGSKRALLPDGVSGTYRCVERERGEFERHIQLPQVIDPRRSTSRLENGLLTIELPKIQDQRDRAHPIPIVVEPVTENE